MLRRSLLIAALAAVTASAAGGATPTPLRGQPQFVISGHGWGHGVGMSQYGAYGFAQKGYTYDQILAHYYPGTELGAAPVDKVRVLLGTAKTMTISSSVGAKVRDATGATTTLPAGTWKLGPAMKMKLPTDAQARTQSGPLVFLPTTQPLQVNGRAYRGTFVVSTDGKKVTVVNNVGLEQYLYGVVPSEMPFSWHPEALKAQAVVARSYALAVRKTTGPFDLYPDTRSQVYRGYSGEKPSSNDAVNATQGEVLTYDGKVAVTYFYSTSGGRTAAINDVWNSQPVPYLVSVSDPYDAISPYHDWGPFPFTAAKLDKLLKVPGKLVDVETALNSSGRVSTLTAHGTLGDVTVKGTDVRRILGLRSTWFRVGVLALDPLPAKAVPYGSIATLTGLGRGLGLLKLEQRPVGGSVWASTATTKAKPDGTVSIAVKATAPAQYRLSSSGIASGVATLIVAPTVRLKVPTAPTALSGVVQPAIENAPVQIQRSTGTAWTTVVKARTDAQGSFSASFAVVPGTYRARVAPGKGWAVALSPELQVVKT
jgi:stage II sporulation protein D